MGGGIAALLAGVGIQTTLLDIPPADSQPNAGRKSAKPHRQRQPESAGQSAAAKAL